MPTDTARGNLVALRTRLELREDKDKRRMLFVHPDQSRGNQPRVYTFDSTTGTATNTLISSATGTPNNARAPRLLPLGSTVAILSEDIFANRSGRATAHTCTSTGAECDVRNVLFGIGPPNTRLLAASVVTGTTDRPFAFWSHAGNKLTRFACTADWQSCLAEPSIDIPTVAPSGEHLDETAGVMHDGNGSTTIAYSVQGGALQLLEVPALGATTEAKTTPLGLSGVAKVVVRTATHIYVGGGTGKVGPQGQLVQCTLDTKACTRITTELQVMSVAIDQGRNVAWLATVNAAYTRVRFLRCGLAAGTCETVLDSGDLASAIPAVTMDESNDRVVFAARSVEWFGRPALVVLDRY